MIAVPAKRCSDCAINWPMNVSGCPVCMGPTSSLVNEKPINGEEARKLTQEAEFEREYERRERGERSRCGTRSGPTPEELGRAEAREIIALEASLAAAG